MFEWMTNDQLDFINDMVTKNAETWVEKKYPKLTTKERKIKANQLKILAYQASQVSFELDEPCWNQKLELGKASQLAIVLVNSLEKFVNTNDVSEMYLRDSVKWLGYWARKISRREKIIKDYDVYLDVMGNNSTSDEPFAQNGPTTDL